MLVSRSGLDAAKIVINHEPYLLAFKDSCSAELLKEVSENEDFERGLLWLITPDQSHKAEIIDLVHAVAAGLTGVEWAVPISYQKIKTVHSITTPTLSTETEGSG